MELLAPEFEPVSESLYIIADLDSEAGISLIKEAITSLVGLFRPYFTESSIHFLIDA